MFISIVSWLEENAMSCIYKKFLGIDCPGCGMQRSLILLLKGDLIASIKMYPALIPTIFLLILLLLHLIFKYKNGAIILKITFIINIIIIVAHYIIKTI